MSDDASQGQMQPMQLHGLPNDSTVPDLYVEGVNLMALPNSVICVFNRLVHNPPEYQPVAVVRMSPEQAKLTAMVLRKLVKDFERDVGPISVHPNAMLGAGLPEDTEL